MTQTASPIHLDLFKQVKEYSRLIASSQVDESSLVHDTAIFTFYQNFFLQFFDHREFFNGVVFGPITSFDDAAETEATRLRLSLPGADMLPTRRVIVAFEKFCAMQPTLVAGQYYPDRDAFLRFHKLYIPRLLRSIWAWANAAKLPEVATAAKQSLDTYLEAVAGLLGQPTPGDDVLGLAATKELIRVIELDYDRTSKFIEDVLGTSATIRGLLVTAWVAVLTFAFDVSKWSLAAVSFAIVVVFGVLDAYHSWLYTEALGHAADLEEVSETYYGALALGGDDPDSALDLQVSLQDHHFGIYRSLTRFRIRDLAAVRPQIFFAVLYPALLTVSVICAVVLAATGKGG
jgi:hypothetical protein